MKLPCTSTERSRHLSRLLTLGFTLATACRKPDPEQERRRDRDLDEQKTTSKPDVVAACEDALRSEGDTIRNAEKTRLSESDLQRAVIEAQRICASLFEAATCRHAWKNLPLDGSQAEKQRATLAAIDACHHAYCDSILDRVDGCDDGWLANKWPVLQGKIIAKEWGDDAANSIAALSQENKRLVEERARSRAASPAPPGDALLVVRVTSLGIVFSAPSGDIGPGCTPNGVGVTFPLDLRNPATKIDASALAACARKIKERELPGQTQFTLEAESTVQFRTVVDVLDALREDSSGTLFPDVHLAQPRRP